MWRLILVLVFLVASVWFGVAFIRHPGYLLLVYQPWMVQMPLWFALLSTLITFCLFYLLVDSIDRVNFLFYRFKNWLKRRREHKAYSNTQRGMTSLIEGRAKKAEKLLLAGVSQTSEPLMNYLAAAKAAQAQKAYERRDEYIQKAYQLDSGEEMAIGILQSELEIEQGQFELAAAKLNELRQLSPRHKRVLSLLEKIYTHLADWKQLQALIPDLRQAKVITKEQAKIFEKNIQLELFRHDSFKSLEELKAKWQGLPKYIRRNPEVAYAYVLQLQRFHDKPAMAEVVRKTLKQAWHGGLVKIYANLPFENLNKQLVRVGAWLKLYGQKQETLYTLGCLCTRLQLWGKAKDYFERALALGPDFEISYEYGKLLEHLGDQEEALAIYKAGLRYNTREIISHL